MACYAVELVDERADPLMRAVPCAYILTMHETETFPWLHGVAARTYVQRNRGFRKCTKACGPSDSVGPTIDATYKDLTHAYQSAFDRIERTVDRDRPVLVFEDDARLASNARADLTEVDAFIARSSFCVYTLGSCGLMAPYEPSMRHWMFIRSFFSFTHACIYSPRARAIVRSADACSSGHFDSGVLARLPAKLTFYRPIAYQPLGESENSKTWCVKCDGGAEDTAHRSLARALIRLMKFDTEPEAAFDAAYRLQRVALIVPLVATVVLVALYVALSSRPWA